MDEILTGNVSMKRILIIVGLELYALLLTGMHLFAGVKTDEAKYLLNIPYPHPPFARFILSSTEWIPMQELLWRFIFATLMVQAVWLVLDMARRMSVEKKITLAGLWLFSGSVVFQAGTIMMAPLTALQGLVFLWLLLKNEEDALFTTTFPGWITLFWIISLFTAYQAILYTPLVWMIFWRMKRPLWQKSAFLIVPTLLVLLYIATNPLAAASFINAGGQNVVHSIGERLVMIVGSLLRSGGWVLSVVGVCGLLHVCVDRTSPFAVKNAYALMGSFLLVCAFLFVSFRLYYAALFVPLLIAGVACSSIALKKPALLLALQVIAAVILWAQTPLQFYPPLSRVVMQTVNELPQDGALLMAGGFGHDWQYESDVPVLRYRSALLSQAKAVVCLDPCPDMNTSVFYRLWNVPVEAWVRR